MRLLFGLVVLLLCSVAPASAQNPFDLARKPEQIVLVSLGETPPPADILSQPPMLQRLSGVLGELKGQQIVDLSQSVDTKRAAPADEAGTRVCVVHISGPAGARTVRIERTADGGYRTEVIGPIAGAENAAFRPVLLKRAAFEAVLNSLNGGPAGGAYFGGFDGPAEKEPRGAVFEVPQPYVQGAFQLDGRTLRERIIGSSRNHFDPSKRDLAAEKFFVRLPTGYDPVRPAGLVVWVDASPSGLPPDPLFKALDAYGMICIAASNSGNDREVADRLQLALDVVATAKQRWHIDPSRVYAAGISGGGKMASMLLPGFPDVFGGALPLVGLACYASVPTGQPNTVWPPEFGKPSGKLWGLFLQRRTAAVTGSKDFNRAPVVGKAKAMQADKVEVRVFDIEGMGHEFPPAEAIVAQLGWVDERARAAADQAKTEAAAAMATPGVDRKGQLLEIVRRWPWTPGAWEAVRELTAH